MDPEGPGNGEMLREGKWTSFGQQSKLLYFTIYPAGTEIELEKEYSTLFQIFWKIYTIREEWRQQNPNTVIWKINNLGLNIK